MKGLKFLRGSCRLCEGFSTRSDCLGIAKLWLALLAAIMVVAVSSVIAPTCARAADLCNNFNSAPVFNRPNRPTYCGLWAPAHVDQIITYHWNNGSGAPPGTLSLRAMNGHIYGPFQAHSGWFGAPVDWVADVNLTLPAGIYRILDSDPNTWSQNFITRGWGFAIVRGTSLPPPPLSPPRTAFVPLPLLQFCVRNSGAYADTSPCTGPVKPFGFAFTARLKRPLPVPFDSVAFFVYPYHGSIPAIPGGIAVSTGVGTGTGTAVNDEYTITAFPTLCLNPQTPYAVRVFRGGVSQGDIGIFYPDCR